jgi:alpha-glucuronidase
MHFPPDESGYEAWLRYPPQASARRAELAPLLRVANTVDDARAASALAEWTRAMRGWGVGAVERVEIDGAGLGLTIDRRVPAEGWRARALRGGRLVIAGGDASGLLYGVLTALVRLGRGASVADLADESVPATPLRMLNHWDNLVCDPVHGSIERVKGGDTIFDWTDLTYPNPRYEDYARMLASVGLNGVCVNNVNAEPEILASATIRGLAALAAIFRRWGVRLFLSVNFASPVLLGGLTTADPLEPAVRSWWAAKADELYAAVPDFGGWLVKADSEGKPGPGTYGRGHVEGSACLAEALAPHGGVLLWRTFVYGRDYSARTPHALAAADRANAASYEFMHLDGQFEDNVILQVKCSAIDFQTWEPVHALLGKLPRTRVSLELALTKEYAGLDTHLGWEGDYFSHVLNFDASGEGACGRVAALLARRGLPGAITAVANVNNSRNWFGHLMSGATLFTYGRLAWTPDAEPRAVLREWAELTFGAEAAPAVVAMLSGSYDVVASYTMPMGLTYICELLHHFDPDPWENHRGAGITKDGIGTDRSVATGSAYAGLYPAEFAARVESPASCPTKWLLYFHHLPWSHRMPDGRTLIQTLYDGYADGVATVGEWRRAWRGVLGKIDLERWAHVNEKLALQERHAARWRDLACRYLAEVSGVADERGRFSARMPSEHNRVRSAFWKAVEDYRSRVARERAAIGAVVAG